MVMKGYETARVENKTRKIRHPPQLVEHQIGNQKGQDNALRFTVCYYEVIHHLYCGSKGWAKYHMGPTEAVSPILFWLLWSLWKLKEPAY